MTVTIRRILTENQRDYHYPNGACLTIEPDGRVRPSSLAISTLRRSSPVTLAIGYHPDLEGST